MRVGVTIARHVLLAALAFSGLAGCVGSTTARPDPSKFLPHPARQHVVSAAVPMAGAWNGAAPSWGPYSYVDNGLEGAATANPDAYTAIFINTVYPGYTAPPGVPIHLNLSQFGVPADTVSAFIGGILIETGGYALQDCNLTVEFREVGSTQPPGNYIFQAVTQTPGNGQRSTASTWVPVKYTTIDGVTGSWIEYVWGRGDTQTQWPAGDIQPYPQECAYGMNLTVPKYMRKPLFPIPLPTS